MLDLVRALPPWYRQRALADLDRLIAQLEDSTLPHPRTRKAATAARTGRPSAMDARLALLHQSRQVLLAAQSSTTHVN